MTFRLSLSFFTSLSYVNQLNKFCKFKLHLTSVRAMSVSIKDIAELNAKHVHIKNKDEVINKINVLINGGKDSLQVVSDYDMTLTKQHENGKQHVTSFGKFFKYKNLDNNFPLILID